MTHSSVATISTMARCQLCTVILTGDDDDYTRRLCVDCLERPEAKRLTPARPSGGAAPRPPARPPAPAARAFTAADRSLIANTHGYLPLPELLRVLNERLHADVGPAVPDYTLEQLHAALREVSVPTGGAGTWVGLRQVLAQARREGTLSRITPAMVEAFAVVWQLAPAQVMQLREVLRGAQEDA